MADLAEEEGGWLSVEEMMGQIHKNDQFLVEQSTSQVNMLILFRFEIVGTYREYFVSFITNEKKFQEIVVSETSTACTEINYSRQEVTSTENMNNDKIKRYYCLHRYLD